MFIKISNFLFDIMLPLNLAIGISTLACKSSDIGEP